MSNPAKLSQDHMVTLCALEVLNLIADRLERRQVVDLEDVQSLLRFLREVAHRCLDNTEKALLLPFLEMTLDAGDRRHLGATLANHRASHALLDELERSFHANRFDEFLTLSRRYTNVLGDLIFHEESFLPVLLRPLSENGTVLQMIADFDRVEDAVAAKARAAGDQLRRLEIKYVSPHCI